MAGSEQHDPDGDQAGDRCSHQNHVSQIAAAVLGSQTPGHRKWNPLCVVLPCHRVVASSGALTAYSGGLAAKEYLLALESRP